jgi:hypothetical protein
MADISYGENIPGGTLNSGDPALGAAYYLDPNNPGIPDPNTAVSGGPQPNVVPAAGVGQGSQSGAMNAPTVAPAAPAAPLTQVQKNMPKEGGLTASPTEVTAANITNLQQQQELAQKQGQSQGTGLDAAAQIQHNAAVEKQQQAVDYSQLLQKGAAESQEDHNRIVSAYNEHRAAAQASGEDPTNAFWKDHGGFAGRLLGALGAFASGMGAGMLGKGGNPFLDHINEEINKNFAAHQQHIKDLYNSAVEAGEVGKSDQDKQSFEQKSKLQYYDLASQYVQHQLDEVSNATQSNAVKMLADKTKLDLDNQITGQRSNLYQQQAAQGAAAAAMQRKNDAEVRTAYQASLAKHMENLNEQDARVEASKDMEATFGSYPQYHGAIGALRNQLMVKDPTTGKMGYPETMANSPNNTTPEGIPLNDEFGHRRKPEEIDKDRQLVITLPDGTHGIANSPDDKKKAEVMSNASQKVDQFRDLLSGPNGLIAKFSNGTITQEEIGKWDGARAAAVAATKGAETGSTGITGIGQIKMLSPEQFPEAPMGQSFLTGKGVGNIGYVGSQLTNWVPKAQGMMTSLKEFSDENKKAISTYIRPSANNAPNTTQKLASAPTKLIKPGDLPDVK